MQSKKYLLYQYEMSQDEIQRAGLKHQTSNLYAFLKESYLLNRIAVIPKFHLGGLHNNGQDLSGHLDKYYDFENLKINGKRNYVIFEDEIKISNTSKETLVVGMYQNITYSQNMEYPIIIRKLKNILWRIPLYENYKEKSSKIKISLPPSRKVQRIAQQAVQELKKGGGYCSVHVRRGDRLDEHIGLRLFTSVFWIKRILKRNIPADATLFIMSDERKPGYFDSLESLYHVYHWNTIPAIEGRGMVSEDMNDNYFLFAVEQSIWKEAYFKIGTFDPIGEADCVLYPRFLDRSRNIQARTGIGNAIHHLSLIHI